MCPAAAPALVLVTRLLHVPAQTVVARVINKRGAVWSLQEPHTSSSSSYRATVRALVSSMSQPSAVQQRRVATMGPLLGHSPAAASTPALQQQGLSQLRCVQSVYSRYSVDSQQIQQIQQIFRTNAEHDYMSIGDQGRTRGDIFPIVEWWLNMVIVSHYSLV